MKNYTAFILSIATVIAVGFGFSSCKEDEPPAKPKLSFSESTMTVNEDDGTIEVELVLDKAYSKDLNIEYDLGGTASDQDDVGTADADYEVQGDHGVVVIESGETTGVIELDIYNDSDFEEDETIEISIIDINTSDVELTADDEIEITITNDDEQVQASFPASTMTVNEDDSEGGFVQVTVQLDKVAAQDITVEYTLGTRLEAGVAIDSLFAANYKPNPIPPQYYDYYINGVAGKLVIPKGATSANIEIQILTDFMFEGSETIDITLTGGNASPTNKTMRITLEQQNGTVIALLWDDPAYTDVDMDLFLWTGEDIDNLDFILAAAQRPSVTLKEEVIFFPAIIADQITNGAFGLSHNYYSGSADPLTFEVVFADYTDGEFEATNTQDLFTATYTAVNKNPYEDTKVIPPIVQTFKIVDGSYVDITEITVPSSGSRMKTQKLPRLGRRSAYGFSRPL